MKLHRNLVVAVVETLDAIFDRQLYSDRVLEKLFREHPRWGARDRGFIAESVYEIVRHWRRLWFLLDKEPAPGRLWRLFGVWWLSRGNDLPDWPEFEGMALLAWQERQAQAQANRVLRESIPDWLDQVAQAELGDLWEPTLAALNQPAEVVLRANTLKTTRDQLAARLQADHIATRPVGDSGLVLAQRRNIFTHPAFQEGWLEVQDAASQEVAVALQVQPGQTVIDACAGGGGKTLHLAALMQNQGRLLALDVEEWKLENLKTRARRAGAHNIEARPIVSRKTIKRLRAQADRVLIDAPCSGLGVLRRNPDAKWKLSAAMLDEIRARQQSLLQDYSTLCKPGGWLMYVTCSVLPSENQQQIQQFLNERKGQFRLREERTLLPQEFGFDGFYIAVLEHCGQAEAAKE